MALREQRHLLATATEPTIAWLRLFVVALTGIALLAAGMGVTSALTAWGIILAAGVYAGTDSALALYKRFRSLLTRRVYVLIDVAFITALLLVTGGATSPVFGLYALPLVVLMLQHGPRHGGIYCVGVSLLYALVAGFATQYPPDALGATWLVQLGILWAMYLVLGYVTADDPREERARRRDELGALQRAAGALTHTGDIPTVIHNVLAGVTGPTRCSRANIYLYDQDTDTFTTCYTFTDNGRDGELAQQPAQVLSSDILFQIVYTGNHVSVQDIHTDSRFAGSVVHRDGARSAILMPLIAPGARRVGVLGLAWSESHKPSQHELRFTGTLAMQAASAIHTAVLFEEAASLEAAKEADRLRSQLLATVSHELRTPIAAIQGFASSLKCSEDLHIPKDLERDWIDEIELNAERLRRLVTDLLDLSRLEAGALRMELAWADFRDILDDLRPNLQVLAGTRNLVIQHSDSLPLVKCDSERIGQVILNLVENAAKFSPPDSNLVVGVERYEGGIRCGVLDEGEGIPQEFQHRVFERFYQVEDASYRQQGGTGLGLAICKSIMDAHGGSISVESTVGQGSIFYFTVPSSPSGSR